MKVKSVQKYKLNAKHKEAVKKRSAEKYCMDKKHRKHVKNTSKLKYHTNDTLKKSFLMIAQ